MIIIKSPYEIEQMSRAGKIAREVLEEVVSIIRPGKTTREMDTLAHDLIIKKGAKPAFLGYKGYPFSICTSINDQVVHGLPGDYMLKEGDIVSIDLGVEYKGYYGDLAVTVPVGKVSDKAQRLIEITDASLNEGIKNMYVGRHLSDISASIQNCVEREGFSVVKAFVGHGIGQQLHEDPQIPNYGSPGYGPVFKEGMVFALEPMVNEGCSDVSILKDGWTAVTSDGSLSAHFEHTVVVTKDGPRILTS